MTTVESTELIEFTAALLEKLGVPADPAAQVAASIVAADRRGHGSHGVFRIPTLYRKMIRDGALVPDATPVVDNEGPAFASIDGRFAFGHLVGQYAVDVLTNKASENGIAVVGMRNATHLGRIGEWAEKTADRGFIFQAYVNAQGGGRQVAPVGSARRRFATNPVVSAIPTFDALPYPIVLDMATSQVAHGKIAERDVADKPLPDDWAIRPDGQFETNARAFEEGSGAMLPLGGTATGHKGFGLAVIAELMAGIIGRGPIVGQGEPEWFSNAAVFIGIDPTLFSSEEEIEEIIRTLESYINETEYDDMVPTGDAAKGERALLPGEREYNAMVRMGKDAVELEDRTIGLLVELADELDCESQLPAAFESAGG